MRTGIGFQPGHGINAVQQRGNIRKAAKNLRIGLNQFIVQIRQQLIRICAADNCKHRFHVFVGKRLMNIGDSVFNRRRTGHIPVFVGRIAAETDFQPQRRKPLRRNFAGLLTDNPDAARRRNHSDFIAGG